MIRVALRTIWRMSYAHLNVSMEQRGILRERPSMSMCWFIGLSIHAVLTVDSIPARGPDLRARHAFIYGSR